MHASRASVAYGLPRFVDTVVETDNAPVEVPDGNVAEPQEEAAATAPPPILYPTAAAVEPPGIIAPPSPEPLGD
ncbi:MAG: hypothetical protein JKY37_22920 [Nannocystaceae bacterium]|nr:hypothetical protein [Nannocystaceae bacterium]